MDAGSRLRGLLLGLTAFLVASLPQGTDAADARSQNFIVFAPNQQLAHAVAESAERYRKELATYWLGKPLPPWPAPCPIRVISGPNLAAQGLTTYNPRPVGDFQMEVVGTPQRILDSVLPHEVTHTVLATHFGRPLPRWADEGICTTVEHVSERKKHDQKLREYLSSRRGIAMNRMFLMTEYPHDILPLYAQGYSVCRFLIAQKGPRQFIDFLQDYMRRPSWTANIKKHYQYDSLKELQDYWVAWVDAGCGDVEKFAKVMPQRDATSPGQTGQLLAGAAPTAQPRADSLVLQDARGRQLTPAGAPSSAANQTVLSAVQPEPGTALASATSDGWYQRRRDQVLARGTVPQSHGPTSSIAPPSVRDSGRYSASQPQPEQGISRSGQRF